MSDLHVGLRSQIRLAKRTNSTHYVHSPEALTIPATFFQDLFLPRKVSIKETDETEPPRGTEEHELLHSIML